MKRIQSILMIFCMMLSIAACGPKPLTWQEQYDLGVRYLSEGNYQEAIIAFTAAIEIDPKRTETYTGLVEAYLAMGEYDKVNEVWEMVDAQEWSDELLAMISVQTQKHEAVRVALENGDPGLWITGLSYDKESFVSGQETEFKLTIFYNCPPIEEYLIYTGADTAEKDRYSFVGDGYSVHGTGIIQVPVSATPVFWKNRFFALYVSLRTENEGMEISSDRIYITDEGLVTDYYANRNHYGGTEFSARNNYQEFTSLEPSEQRRITTIAETIVQGNKDELLSLIHTEDGINGQYLTEWNGYKVEISDRDDWSVTNSLDDATDHSKWFSIEMRSENGIGYVGYVNDSYTQNTTGKESWLDYHQTVRLISCPCIDWQWNGNFLEQEWVHYFWRSPCDENERRWYHSDYVTCETVEETEMNGTMVMSLRDGKATATVHEVSNWSNHQDLDETNSWTDTYIYENGVLVSKNGETWTGGKGYHFIDGSGGGISYSDEQYGLDEKFW
ncbi:MAG: tetratricopeptide repeat protein [Lawsonibacter sp.]|jgi:tetratricopeptide (TPR) repeat protein|nr:tetratricopeptide repeat protein [Lawsonibacter sp.]